MFELPLMETKPEQMKQTKDDDMCAECGVGDRSHFGFCSKECRDKYYPPDRSVKGGSNPNTVTTKDLQARVEECRLRAAEEAGKYIPMTLTNGVMVSIVPNELLDARQFPRLELTDHPTCYECGKEIWIGLTKKGKTTEGGKWIRIDQVGDKEFSPHVITCKGRRPELVGLFNSYRKAKQ